jgi:ABC-type polysaccharide/polyol phosphate export permease
VLNDLTTSLKHYHFWLYGAWLDLVLRYRSTFLGPLWVTATTGMFVLMVGTLYGQVLMRAHTADYFVHLAIGFVAWNFISTVITSSCNLFVNNRTTILDTACTLTDFVLKLLTYRFLYVVHNVVVIIATFLFTGAEAHVAGLVLLITVPLVLLHFVWVSTVFAVLGSRFRDIGEIVSPILRLFFFITPIIWVAREHARGPLVDALLYFNPFYYVLEVIRTPLIYGEIPWFEILVLAVALPFGFALAELIYGRTRPYVVLWI